MEATFYLEVYDYLPLKNALNPGVFLPCTSTQLQNPFYFVFYIFREFTLSSQSVLW